MEVLSLAGLRELLDRGGGAQLVEVLPEEEFGWAHLPGALHAPLRAIGLVPPPALDPSRPVVAYCNDFL